ncbi:MAG: TIGR03085 family metal-binding protein [Acidimicrobiales bacterium]
MPTPFDALERAKLCDLLDELGPDAPTLCEGWDTLDLAAHLVMRERQPLTAPGMLFPAAFGGRLGRRRERATERTKAMGYSSLVDTIRAGPPLLSPFRVPGVRTLVNLTEYFVHHEDVRRANGREPRDDILALEEAFWRILRRGGRILVRGVKGVGVVLVRPDGDEIVARKGDPVVRITGTPGELVLYLNGRKGAGQVTLDGPDAAVKTVEDAPMGV